MNVWVARRRAVVLLCKCVGLQLLEGGNKDMHVSHNGEEEISAIFKSHRVIIP